MFSYSLFEARTLQTVQQTTALKQKHDLVDNRSNGLLRAVDREVGLRGCLIGVIDTSEALNLTGAGTSIDTTLISTLAVLQGCSDVNQIEITVLLDGLASSTAVVLEGSDGGGNHSGTGTSQLAGDEADTGDVLAAVLTAETKLRRKLGADRLTQKHGDGAPTLLVQRDLQGAGNVLLAAVVVARQEDGETLLGAGRVGLAQDLDDLRVREPLGDVAAAAQARAQLRAGDVQRARALRDLVDGHVLVVVGDVRDHLEGDHLDAELVAVLLDGVLGVVGPVPVDALAVLAGPGVVAPHDEVRRAVVLADDGVPDGLAGPAHAHGEGQQAQHRHPVRVSRQKRLVHAHPREVVDVSGLGQTHDRVDQHVGLLLAGGADRQLAVGAVHGVSRLESDDSGPAELVEVQPQFGGGVCIGARCLVSLILHAKRESWMLGRRGKGLGLSYIAGPRNHSEPSGEWLRACLQRSTRQRF